MRLETSGRLRCMVIDSLDPSWDLIYFLTIHGYSSKFKKKVCNHVNLQQGTSILFDTLVIALVKETFLTISIADRLQCYSYNIIQ